MRILIAVDRSEYARIVIEHGLDQAARTDAGEIHVVTAVDRDEDRESARTFLAETLDELLDAFECTDRLVKLHVRTGREASAIAAVADSIAPDLLVIGRFHEPSVADSIISLVPCPTLVVGVEGHISEPQCTACEHVRRDSGGERLFCEDHAGDYLPDLATRVPSAASVHSRLW